MTDAGNTQVTLLSEKLHRFGVLGAGVIPDSLATLRLAGAREEENANATAAAAATASPPVKRVEESEAVTSSGAGGAPSDGTLSRKQVLDILSETVRVQGIVQQEVSVLAKKLASKAEKKKKKPPSLSFVEAHKKILELDLPREPLEDFGLSEASFHRILMEYENDDEVMESANKLLHPAGKGDPQRAQSITMDKIIDIHQFMVVEMQKVLQEFLKLPQETRRTFTGKACETTAELLVSIAVENQMMVRCEDVEQAVIMYEEALQENREFTRCTEQLANMMQHLIRAAQPRVEKSEFVRILRHMAASTKDAKAFAKKLYEDYRAKTCGIVEAYRRFESFSESAVGGGDGGELPDLSSAEMHLCFDEYGEDEEVLQAWEQSGVESTLAMQAMMLGMGTNSGSPKPSQVVAVEDRKGKKLKSSEIVEMQELMVDELKRTTEAADAALKNDATLASQWKAELAVQLVQALASAAVERRYGTSAEEMALAGFQHANVLHKNERFMRATEKQQEILMRIPSLCSSE
mmetsp:Transcript_2078/g.4709  ORF Transcript_2078/g.4709 Transcript_2078/m.4709 type:complete len:521 (-) Transcript_2078:146-1708(-)